MSTLSQFFGGNALGISSGGSIGSTFNIFTESNPSFNIPSNVKAAAYGVLGGAGFGGGAGVFTPGGYPFLAVAINGSSGGGFSYRAQSVTLSNPSNLTITVGAGGGSSSLSSTPTQTSVLLSGPGGGTSSISGTGITTISATGGAAALLVNLTLPSSSGSYSAGGTGSGGNINSSGGNGFTHVRGVPPGGGLYSYFGSFSGIGGAGAGGIFGPGGSAGVNPNITTPSIPSEMKVSNGAYAPIGVGRAYSKNTGHGGMNGMFGASSGYSLTSYPNNTAPTFIYKEAKSDWLVSSEFGNISLVKTFFSAVGGGGDNTLSYTSSLYPYISVENQTTTGGAGGGGGYLGNGGFGAGGGGTDNLPGSVPTATATFPFPSENFSHSQGGFGGGPGISIVISNNTKAKNEKRTTLIPSPGIAAFEYWE